MLKSSALQTFSLPDGNNPLKMTQLEALKEYLRNLPQKPGIYQFADSNGNILYIGKASNLKKRVTSYFTGTNTGKTDALLRKSREIRHIVVENESDALLLENNLIKKHQPKYNILLKDDKTFPWICIKKEPFPRVFSTRTIIKDGSHYFGPYTSALMVRTLIQLIRQIYKLRTCNYSLNRDNIESGKLKVCLEYHIGNCQAPCINREKEESYNGKIEEIKQILRGNINSVIDHLKSLMHLYSKDLRFEEAQAVKERIDLLARYRSKSTVVSTAVGNVDVFGISEEEGSAFINYMKVTEGAVVQAFNMELRSRIEEQRESVLAMAITEIRQRLSSDSREVIVPFMPDLLSENLKYTVPEIGEKKKLLELALRNALYFRLEQKKKKEDKGNESRIGRNLERVRNDLHMPHLPVHIECFDNSNIQGTSPVAACVVFKNGKPDKKEYRHYNVKTVTGADDFSSMEEIVYRRYLRLSEEGKSLPSLVIIDGGKGQLSAAMKSLERLNLRGKITVIGIAKRLEEIYFPGDNVPIYLDKNSYTLKLIQQIRNEAHRFGVNFHRDKRSAEMTKSLLDEIKGIGPRTKEILMRNFDSVDSIAKSTEEELSGIVGASKAGILLKFLRD